MILFYCFDSDYYDDYVRIIIIVDSTDHSWQVYGVCPWAASDVDEKESVLTVITELGEPLDLIKMIQIPWDIRFKVFT